MTSLSLSPKTLKDHNVENKIGGMGKYLLAGAFILLLMGSLIPQTSAQTAEGENKMTLYFFWEEGCPACVRMKRFLEGLEQRYPQIEIKKFEVVWDNGQNVDLLLQMADNYRVAKADRVFPLLFIGNAYIAGYISDDTTGRDIEDRVRLHLAGLPIPPKRRIPLLGEVDLARVSLPLFTLVVAGLDSVNPCVFWVLCFLLTLLVTYAPSRKKVLLVGLVFVATIALIYFLFMTALLVVFGVIHHLGWVRIAIGAMAITMGIINLKEFFWFKRWISLTIPERVKPRLLRRMGRVVREGAQFTVALWAIGLAAFASLVEIPCTVGFPAIYTQALTLQGLSTPASLMYLVAYAVIYVAPLLLLVGIFAHSLSGRKFTERHGRLLKAIGGSVMIVLGLILALNPELLIFG